MTERITLTGEQVLCEHEWPREGIWVEIDTTRGPTNNPQPGYAYQCVKCGAYLVLHDRQETYDHSDQDPDLQGLRDQPPTQTQIGTASGTSMRDAPPSEEEDRQ